MEDKDIIKKFLNALEENKELAAKFLAQKDSMDGAYNVAKPYLFGMSKDDFESELKKLGREILESGEISIDELEDVSGGGGKLKKAGKIIGLGYAGVALAGIAVNIYQQYRLTKNLDKWLDC